MPGVFDIAGQDLQHLNKVQFARLLKTLLILEAGRYEIRQSGIYASLEIDVADGGEDARVEWEGALESTEWFPCRKTLFQCKAQDIGPTACRNEIKTSDGNAIKSRVDEVLSSEGAYVLFCTQSCSPTMREDREKAFRDGLRDCGKVYCDTAPIEIYDAERIALWVNQHVAAIALVRFFTGASNSALIKNWEEWSGYSEHTGSFFADEVLLGKIRELREHFFNGSNRVARIVGLSGIGKTRIALETFRPPDDLGNELERQLLSHECVYLDAEKSQALAVSLVSEWTRMQLSGTIIVDNCSIELHNQLLGEVSHSISKLSLLTLDYKIPRYPKGHTIVLEKVSGEVIGSIIREAYPGLSDNDVNRIVQFAQGFPRMAVLIARAHIDNVTNIANLRDPELVKKLIWQREEPDQDSKTVIEVCSLFDHLGWDNGVSEERIHAATVVGGIDPNLFFRIGEEFQSRRIIDKRGRYIRVVPLPLALTLASEWWRGCSPELARELFLSEMPGEMAQSLCDQLAKLNDIPRAKEIVEKLCDEHGPFSSAEVLLTKQGSRLFRSLVEVDASPCLRVLESVLGSMSHEALLEVGPARRNLVWSLEKLCFWESTFAGAAKLLLALADAENESWGNNATNQFLQLFHVFLSGTQAPPQLRVTIADYALASESSGKQELGVRALLSGIQTGHFSRMGGVEIQGSRASEKDWYPENWDEIFSYQNECISRLTAVVVGDNPGLGKIAAKGFGEGLRWLIRQGYSTRIDNNIREIAAAREGFWPDALFSLRQTIQYEGDKLNPKTRTLIESWIRILQPEQLEERLKLIVSVPDFEHRKTENGEKYIDVAEERALALANDLATDISSLVPLLPTLLTGEQRKASVFGKKLAELIADQEGFAFEVLRALRTVDSEVGNPSLLCGFLADVGNRKIVEDILESVNSDDTLLPYLIDLTRFSKPEPIDLQRILHAVKDERLPVEQLLSFSVNSVLSYMEVDDVLEFSDEICRIGIFGVGCALEILYMYTYQEPTKLEACVDTLRRILLTPGLLNQISTNNRFRGHSWEDVALTLLRRGAPDCELAQHISQELSGLCSQPSFSLTLDQFTYRVLGHLLTDFFDSSWPAFSEALLSKEMHTYLHVTTMLKGYRLGGKGADMLSNAPLSELLNWARVTQPDGPRAITRCLPVLSWTDKDTVSWHQYALSFIDLFGTDQEFLDGISGNLHTFTWVGSIVPYFEKQIALFEELLSHSLHQVRMWARESIDGLKDRIERELGREAEHEFGVF